MRSNSSNSSKEFQAEGNTKSACHKQIAPSKYWCFTLNNPTMEDISSIVPTFSPLGEFIVGEEIGDSGTPHLQGFVKFKKKTRPAKIAFEGRAHWEKCKGNERQNTDYCQKEGRTIHTNMKVPKPIRTIDPEKLYPWQKNIWDTVENECTDERTINWYYEESGNVGKSALCKLLVVKKGAILVGGKGDDIKHGIVSFMEKNNGIAPEIVLIDIPRCSAGFVSIKAIEEVKNGCFFSGKYESAMCVFNSPHIFCFSNTLPDVDKMSQDRWNIVEIV